MAIRVSGYQMESVFFSNLGKFLPRVGQWGIRDSVGLDLLNCFLFRFMWRTGRLINLRSALTTHKRLYK